MAPFVALVTSFLWLRVIGLFGWSYFDDWHSSLQGAVAVMLLFTASAHWGKRRSDLIRMVPPSFPKKEWIVTVTGWLEIAGAIGILLPDFSLAASICLTALLIAMFPANVYAARKKLTIGGKPVPKLFCLRIASDRLYRGDPFGIPVVRAVKLTTAGERVHGMQRWSGVESLLGRDFGRPGDPHFGRSDKQCRYAYGSPNPECDGPADERPNQLRHRPPFVDDPQCGSDSRHE